MDKRKFLEQCRLCLQNFASLDELTNHEIALHREYEMDDNDSPKAKLKDCTDKKLLEEDIGNKQCAPTLEEITSHAVHVKADKIMNDEGIDIPQSTEVLVSAQANIKPKCYLCGRVFKTEVEMKNHIAGCHKDDSKETSCSDCTFKAKTPEELHKHLSNNMHKPRKTSKKTKN